MKKIKNIAKAALRGVIQGVLYPMVYRIAALRRVDPDKVVFLETRGTSLDGSLYHMRRHLEKHYRFRLVNCFLRNGFVGMARYSLNCIKMLWQIGNARCVFVSDACNVLGMVRKRPETTVVQLWHACGAFKKFGMSTAELLWGADRERLTRRPNYANMDFVTVSSPEVRWAYAEAMNLPMERIVADGTARTDRFFEPERKQRAYDKLYRILPEAHGKKLVLYAPTFRGEVEHAVSPDVLDVTACHEQMGEDYFFLIKRHPFTRNEYPLTEKQCAYARDVTDSMTIDELLFISDICITDYSSLIFEYALFEREMIFFAFDIDEYLDWRGFYYPYDELVPGPICRTTEEVIEALRAAERGENRERIRAFREKFMSACDGHATERTLKRAFGDELDAHRT
ncbi:MAG: CDP-glycerol glycerophosphotransferase family protein [Butyricicoccaceae bacterium]